MTDASPAGQPRPFWAAAKRQGPRTLLLALLCGLGLAWGLMWPLTPADPNTWSHPNPWLQVLAWWGLWAWVRRAPSAKQAALRVWLSASVWLSATFWWLWVSMHVVGGIPSVLAALAVWALAAVLALYYAAAGAAYWRVRHAGVVPQALALGALWGLAEWARATWFTGFPWGALSYAWVDVLGHWAPWIGSEALGVAVLVWASALGLYMLRRDALRAAATLALGAAAVWAPLPAHTVSVGSFKVALLQGGIEQAAKFDPEVGIPQALGWYNAAMHEAAKQGAQWAVAPETAIPVLPEQTPPELWVGWQSLSRDKDMALLVGQPLGDETVGYTNSVLGWTPDSPDFYRYDKHHLVPFGEFIPPFFRWFVKAMGMPLDSFSRGELGQAPLAWQGQRVSPNICYEDVFGDEMAAVFANEANAPTWLANVSNIAWFGHTVALDQHLLHARMRALEFERPMVRATNTGPTVVIDHHGQVTASLPRYAPQVLVAEVQGRTGLTPYARWASRFGQWPVVLVCVFVWGWVRLRIK